MRSNSTVCANSSPTHGMNKESRASNTELRELRYQMDQYAKQLKTYYDNNRATINGKTQNYTGTNVMSTSTSRGQQVSIKINYKGTIDSIVAKDKNGNTISGIKLYKTIDGEVKEITKNNIASEESFGVVSPKGSGKEIAQVQIRVKSSLANAIKAEMYVCWNSNEQPKLIVDTSKGTLNHSVTVTYNVSDTGKIVINKTDEEDTSIKLRAGFKIKTGSGWLSGRSGSYSYEETESNATIYYTNATTGKIELSNLRRGTYRVYEVSAPAGYNLSAQSGYSNGKVDCGSKTITNDAKTITYNITNKLLYGNLKIIKKDKDTGEKLAGTEFKIWRQGVGWIIGESNGKYTYYHNSEDWSTAKIFTTDNNGEITINNLPAGKYNIFESKAPEGYELTKQENYDEKYGMAAFYNVQVNENNTTEYKVTNTKDNPTTGKLLIIKRNEYTEDKLTAEFKLWKVDSGWVIKGNDGYTYDNNEQNYANATIFTTDHGEITITGLEPGKYKIFESKAPDGYDLTKQENYNSTLGMVEFETIEVTIESTAVLKATNVQVGSITIYKIDGKTGEKLEGAEITLQDNEGNYYDKNGKISGSEVKISVPKEGIKINNLSYGTYKLTEVTAPGGFNLNLQSNKTKEITLTQENYTIEINVENYQYGDLEIIKLDTETKEPIAGAGFIIKDESNGKYISSYTETEETSELAFTDDKNSALEFTTNANGLIELKNIPVGKYHIYEISSIGQYNITEQDGYDESNEWLDCGTIEVTTNTGTNSPNKITLTNEKSKVTINGYVWLDVPVNKNNDTNSLRDVYEDVSQNEKMIPDVIVKLIKVDGNTKEVLDTQTTNINGEYIFEHKVRYSDLGNCYIEFDYSGTEYKQYIPVAYNETEENGSRALYDDVPTYDSDLTGIVTTNPNGISETIIENFYDEGSNTLLYMNLGIKQLPETSYTLQEDIVEAKIDFGGKEYTYTYGKRGNKDYEGVPVVNWQGKSDIRAYSADIYPSVIAEAVANNKDITATIKYRIDITNTTNYNIEELYVENKLMVSQIQDSFDNSRYELADSNWELVSTSDGKSVAKMKSSYITDVYGNGIAGGETKTSYINFSIKPEAIKDILKHPNGIIEEHPTKAGALAYHEYTRKDYSWNNNITKNQTHKTMEKEETDTAPYLIFKLPEGVGTEETSPRGYVFEDTNVRETSGEVVGNGQYEADETKLSGIQVELLDKDGNLVTLYKTINTATEGGALVSTGEVEEGTNYDSLVVASPASTTTNDEGKYSFVGVLPDTTYYIRFTYGDGTQKIADYKSTIVTSDKVQNVIKGNDTSKDWYKNIGGNNYSVATDDLSIRKEYNTNNDSHTTIPAETPIMEFTLETLLDGTGLDVFNFGIITLPKQELTIDKNITNIKITNTQGNIILDGNPAVDVMSGVSAIVDGNATGYVRIELPEDEIYGSKLTITYEIIVTNVSDINYYETESQYEGCYYLFGDSSHAQEVTTTAKEVLDYLDPALKYVSSSPDGRVTEKNASEYQTYADKQEEHMYTEYTREEDYDKVLSITNWEQLYSNKKDGRKSADVVEIVAERTLTTEDDDMELISTAEIITPTPTPSSLIPNKVKLPERVDAITTIMPPTGSDLQSIVIYTIAGIASLVVLAAGVIIIKKKVLK